MDIQQESEKLQIYLRKDIVGEDKFLRLEWLDLGDVIGVKGEVFKTKTGEITVLVKTFTILSKCLHPLPQKWYGLKDVEKRYRQRYSGLWRGETPSFRKDLFISYIFSHPPTTNLFKYNSGAILR